MSNSITKANENIQLQLFDEKITLSKKSYHPVGSERERLENKFKDIIYEDMRLGSFVSYVGNKNLPFLNT